MGLNFLGSLRKPYKYVSLSMEVKNSIQELPQL